MFVHLLAVAHDDAAVYCVLFSRGERHMREN